METNDTTPNPPTNRMVRPLDGRMVAGVATAYARRLDVDVNLVRIAFVVSAFFGGFGLAVYLATWALLPDEGADRSPAQRWFGKN